MRHTTSSRRATLASHRAVVPLLRDPQLEGALGMLAHLFHRVARVGRHLTQALGRRLAAAATPVAPVPVAGTLADLVRSRPALVAENAPLRQQLLILRRSVNRPRCTPADRALLVLLASRVRAWRQALLLVQPDTLLCIAY